MELGRMESYQGRTVDPEDNEFFFFFCIFLSMVILVTE